jgi:DNA-directed RNA polymerase alpha subunit
MSIEQLRIREEKSEETDVNLLLIDNDFSLVRAFSYEVEEAIDDFIGTTKDVIKFTMTTISPLIDPKDIMSFSAEVLCSY